MCVFSIRITIQIFINILYFFYRKYSQIFLWLENTELSQKTIEKALVSHLLNFVTICMYRMFREGTK